MSSSLCRAEELKQGSTGKKPRQPVKPVPKPRNPAPLTAFRDADSNSSKTVRSDGGKPAVKRAAKFTEEELKVLM